MVFFYPVKPQPIKISVFITAILVHTENHCKKKINRKRKLLARATTSHSVGMLKFDNGNFYPNSKTAQPVKNVPCGNERQEEGRDKKK